MCDICSKGVMIRVCDYLIDTLNTLHNKNEFKTFVISRYKAHQEYNKAWSKAWNNAGYYSINTGDIFLLVKNHFPKEYVEYGIDKLAILL